MAWSLPSISFPWELAFFISMYSQMYGNWQYVYMPFCRSDFGGAATIAECLLVLSKSTQWKEAVSLSVFSPLHTRAEVRDDTTSMHCV